MAPRFSVDYSGQRNTKKCSPKGNSQMKGPKGMPQMKGKTRKVSKGFSSGLATDYRHAVETMAESEEFGSSGRIDTEITASEDSCATKRRCIRLSASNNDRFGVPVQVLSLSKMSQPERKNLELSLKRELEQIKALQKKIASSSNSVAMSPTSDIHNGSDGQRRRVPAKSQRPIGVSASQGKKRAPPGRNGPQAKMPAAGRSDSAKRQALPLNASNAMLMKQCETLLGRLMQHQHSWVFNTPVDVVKFNIPDYHNVIKHPMDLGTVKSKLISGEYLNPLSFAEDVRLTFSNAMTYNPKGNDFHLMAETLRKYFEIRWKQIEKKLHATKSELAHSKSNGSIETETAIPMPQLTRSRSSVSIETETAKRMPRKENSKSSVYVETETAQPKPQPENNIKNEPCKRTVTDIDKHKLSSELEELLTELPENIIDFLKESSSTGNQTGVDEDEIEIDIEILSDDTLFKLRKLLDDYLVNKQKSQTKTEQRVMELHNESGFSNSSLQPLKGNDPVDEEVDIGGNDIPVSSFPPLEIEKDTALRNTRCSSSSSSSGDSASSSSESDSGASSGSEVDGAKASVPVNTAKEMVGSGANIEPKKTNLMNNTKTGDNSLNMLNQGEQDCEFETVCVEADGRLEGESGPPERQASPDKRYRAAVLIGRFADTILKAQEKTTLGKDEKQDPEKLRLEKEELERRRKEEKARLQAEAKAAEDAQKKAEAEAAAEAKRKRELEREAARQALQKMEKTVDINENCHFMGDLEMLGVAPDENIITHSLVDETSPYNYSQDGGSGFGSFKFQGNSNPLQQLGLYMKDDYDEEEEGADPKSVSPTVEVDDPEEGEID